MHDSTTEYDVAIIGGGPGGSTLATLLKKYNPDYRVVILEKEKFPREHVGESQLPPIGAILDEMGCWDKIEAANFPIKIGVTFRWGKSPQLWDFELLPLDKFTNEPRPAPYAGQRKQTALQVERAIYDDILLNHARELGAEARQETKVSRIQRDGDRVTGFELQDGRAVHARYYIDASGHTGVLRRALGVETTVPTRLQNVAFWDYWENAEWAVEIGVGGTRVQIMSQPYGWLWFIPLGPTRTSVGLVCPGSYYKSAGKSPEELYINAVRNDPHISKLIQNATRRGELATTTDWSFMADRTYGENWFLVGESAGFADPILSAGLTLTHTGARELAYTILELDRGELDPAWLKEQYDFNQRSRVHQHIRFADFWYASNGQFEDLQNHCAEIARESGLRMSPAAAWRWLAQGGFTNDYLGQVGIGGLDLAGVKQITQKFTDKQVRWQLSDYNIFKLNLVGAAKSFIPRYEDGRITQVPCHTKGEKRLPVIGMFASLIDILQKHHDIESIVNELRAQARASLDPRLEWLGVHHAVQALEVMVNDGWVLSRFDKRKPRLNLETPTEGEVIHSHRDEEKYDRTRQS